MIFHGEQLLMFEIFVSRFSFLYRYMENHFRGLKRQFSLARGGNTFIHLPMKNIIASPPILCQVSCRFQKVQGVLGIFRVPQFECNVRLIIVFAHNIGDISLGILCFLSALL